MYFFFERTLAATQRVRCNATFPQIFPRLSVKWSGGWARGQSSNVLAKETNASRGWRNRAITALGSRSWRSVYVEGSYGRLYFPPPSGLTLMNPICMWSRTAFDSSSRSLRMNYLRTLVFLVSDVSIIDYAIYVYDAPDTSPSSSPIQFDESRNWSIFSCIHFWNLLRRGEYFQYDIFIRGKKKTIKISSQEQMFFSRN